MTLKQAIEILDYHQEWRLGKRDDMIHEPKALTEALDMVLAEVKKIPCDHPKEVLYDSEYEYAGHYCSECKKVYKL